MKKYALALKWLSMEIIKIFYRHFRENLNEFEPKEIDKDYLDDSRKRTEKSISKALYHSGIPTILK